MSFILDALRKSETARRRSEAPDLFATMPGTAAPVPARTQWPLLAIGGVGVLSLIAALWLFAQRSPAPPASLPASGAITGPNTLPATATATETQTPALLPPTPEVPDKAIAAEASTAPMKTPAAPVATPAATTIARDLPAPPPDTAPPAPQMQTAMPTTGDQIVSLADIDADARKQLPPLKLSMHLWNETPSQRFVIVDGQRLKEGDMLGDIVVERITRDGAVLAWRGSRLKIELR